MGIYIGDTPILSSGGGKSPYEVAKENGYTGTEAEFNAALVEIDDFYTKEEVNAQFASITHADKHAVGGQDEVTPASIGAYTQEEVDNMLQEKQNVINGLEKQLQSRPNPNLLDNWYFGNPVNQRGQTEYTGAGYTIDRWKLGSGGLLLVEDGYISFDPLDGIARNLEQPAEIVLEAGTYTISALLENAGGANIICGVGGGYKQVSCPNDEKQVISKTFSVSERTTFTFYIQATKRINIYAAGMELGSQQTLAHQDENGNWVLNEIPDYGEQLARCQRYFYNPLLGCSNYTYFASGQATSTTKGFITVPTPTTMRAAPVVDFSGLHLTSVSGGNLPITSISSSKKTAGAIQLACDVASGLVAGDACLAVLVDYTAGHLWFDANL